MSITEQLRTNLKKYREAAHLNGAELSRRSGVSRAYIWQIEHGESAPSIEVVQQLAAGLGITIETLLGLEGKVPTLRLEEQQHAWMIAHQDADSYAYDTDHVCIQATYVSPMQKAKWLEQGYDGFLKPRG